MQPFIPMFIFGGGYEMVESERLRSEEALKALVDEWNANPEPSFGYDVIMGLADSNRELCDHVGETRLRNRPSSMLARSLSDADTCAAIGKMQRRSAAAVMREIRGDREGTGHRHRDDRASTRTRLHHQRGLGDYGAHKRCNSSRRRGALLRPA